MSLRSFLAAVLSLLAATLANAAPAPFPRPGGNEAEVVLEAKTAERARLAVIYLRSKSMTVALARAGVEKTWREKGPTIEVTGTRVRVRIAGAGNALATVTAASEAMAGERLVSGGAEAQAKARAERKVMLAEYAHRLAVIRKLQELRGNKLTGEEVRAAEEALARYEFEAEP